MELELEIDLDTRVLQQQVAALNEVGRMRLKEALDNGVELVLLRAAKSENGVVTVAASLDFVAIYGTFPKQAMRS